MNFQEFLRTLDRSGPAPAYFFSGPELFNKELAVEKITASIPEGQRDFNLDRFHLPEADLGEVLAAARTLPFLAPRRVVLLRGLEKLRSVSAEAARLEAYLKAPVQETTLLLTTEDAGGGKSWSRRLAGLCEEVAFRPLRGRALSATVRRLAEERGVRIVPEAMELLLEETGADLSRLSQEVEKLALYLGPGGEVGVGDVRILVRGYAYQAMFDFVQSVCDRDVRRGMMQAADLFEAGADPAGVVGMLAKRLRTLWYLAADDSGRRGSVPSPYRIQQWQLADLRRQAAGFTKGEIEGLLERLLRMDSMIKSRPVSFRLLLEDFVLSLGGKGAFPSLA